MYNYYSIEYACFSNISFLILDVFFFSEIAGQVDPILLDRIKYFQLFLEDIAKKSNVF